MSGMAQYAGSLKPTGYTDANKVIDITAYANRFEGVPNRYVTADYYLEDLIRKRANMVLNM